MLKIDKNVTIPSISYAKSVLELHKQKCPTFIDFDKLSSYWAYYVQRASELEERLYEQFEYIRSSESTPKQWFQFKMRSRGYASLLPKTKKGAISFDAESIKGLIEDGKVTGSDADELLNYIEWNSMCVIRSTLDKMMMLPLSELSSYDGHRMAICYPIFAEQMTGRIGMQNPAIQNLARVIQDIVTVPRGYVLIHCDSGQIEPRSIYSTFLADPQIQYLINLYGDAYYGVLHYAVYLTDEEIASGRLDIQKLEVTKEMENMRPEIKTYNNAVMYGSTSNIKNSKVKAALIKRIGEHPLRKKKLNEIEKQLYNGNYIFQTYFGTPIDIRNSDKLKVLTPGTEEYFYECNKLAINNPIQGAAADLMRYSISQADKIIREKAKDSYIIDYVHDAGRFCVSEKDYDKVGDYLKDIVGYEVDGWIPIYAEAEVGRCAGMYKDLV